MASLFVIQGRDQGKRFELDENVQRVGRDHSNSIQLHDTEVSRRHAEIRKEEDQYVVVDLGSSNGSFVNHVNVERQPLNSGDRVQFGRTLMIYTGRGDSAVENLDDVVDIVSNPMSEPLEESRIIKSISQEEGSHVFGTMESARSPWLARARSNLQIMYRTALAVSHTLDIDQLLQSIMDLIFEWVETDRGCIMLVDRETDLLTPKVRKTHKRIPMDEKISISRTILDYVMEHKEGVLTSDAREDQRWNPEGSIVSMGVREAICVPMQGRYGIVGVIYIDTFTPPGRMAGIGGSNRFSEDHLKLMVAIAHQAALAIEDTSYYSAMVQAERLAAIGQTIATLSHHIKNILQGIRGGSYLIKEGLNSSEFDVVQKGWGIVEKNQEKISNLVLDMLTFSKEREPEPVPGQLNTMTADVVELMHSRADEMNVSLLFTPDKSMPTLMFDLDAMHRALLNIVTNAIDACESTEGGESNRPPGEVTVATEYDADNSLARITVSDNGEGIAADDIEKIFTFFESRKGSRGTGLGLSVSQKILREHNGDIHVESTLGHGSTFTLEIPATPAEG